MQAPGAAGASEAEGPPSVRVVEAVRIGEARRTYWESKIQKALFRSMHGFPGLSRECPCSGRRQREKSGHADSEPGNSQDSDPGRQIGVRSIDNDKLACAGTFRLNSARTATATASATLGREPSASMAGTAEAASGTASASVRLKAPRTPLGIFGIVSSASDRAAAKGKTD
jgi:hypothetical protein